MINDISIDIVKSFDLVISWNVLLELVHVLFELWTFFR